MVKRIVVAGSRDYENYEEVKTYIEACIRELQKKNTLIFLSGGCRGVDMLGERYAKENGFPIERYPANWKKYGKSAGPKRNLQMVRICDGVICFWDGKSKGTDGHTKQRRGDIFHPDIIYLPDLCSVCADNSGQRGCILRIRPADRQGRYLLPNAIFAIVITGFRNNAHVMGNQNQ